jgi:lysophospholipase L1-like esterase
VNRFAKEFLFRLTAALLVLGVGELLAMAAWTGLVRRAATLRRGVDLSSTSLDEPNLGYLLEPNRCDDLDYGQHDPGSYAAGTPKWELCANSLGFRGPEFSVAREPRTYRVVCMGDSSTMGQGVDVESTYCHLFGRWLERRLAAKGLRVETINAGIWGYSSYQGLILYEKYVRQWHGDLHIVAYGTNDRMPLQASGRTLRDRFLYRRPDLESKVWPMPVRRYQPYLLRMATHGIKIARERWQDATRRRTFPEGEVPFAQRRSTPTELRENLATLLRGVQGDSSSAIVVGIAVKEWEYAQALRQAAGENLVPFVPTWALFAEAAPRIEGGQIYASERREIERWFTPDARRYHGIASRYLTIDGAHPTFLGHRIIAEELCRVYERTKGV